MKVYIDENDIGKTVSYKEADGVRQYLYVHDKEGFVIKHLAEHDKQVRKQVVQEIKEKILKHFNVKSEEEYEKSLSLLDALFTADVVFEILDQIQGV